MGDHRSVTNADLYYETLGTEGDPVVMVHGSWVDHRTWNLLGPLLAGAMRVMSYDRRGHGDSTGAARVHPLAEDAQDLAELLLSTDHYPAHVVGHSYGGNVALALAIERPELVRSLVVHEPSLLHLLDRDPTCRDEATMLRAGIAELVDLIGHGRAEEAARSFVNRFAEDPAAWDRLSPEWKGTFLRNAPRWREEFTDPATDGPDPEALAEFVSPVLVTEGALSPPFLRRMSDALADSLRNARRLRLPEVGHFPQITHPALYVGVLHRFLVERDVPAL